MSEFSDTIHRFATKFGFKTKHKLPTKPIEEKQFSDLTDQLYPTGRVWRLFNDTKIQELHKSINDVFLQLQNDSYALINSAIPDNDFFTIEDCEYWEDKLGLFSSAALSLELRKQIIAAKLSFPRNIKARQSLTYIQRQIELYGFEEVKIYPNYFENEDGSVYYMNPRQISGISSLGTQHGGITQHGNSTQHGDSNFEVIANEIREENYSIGGDVNLWSTFFIASKNSLYEKGSVPSVRKEEFKELILKLKPAHLVAFTFLTYN